MEIDDVLKNFGDVDKKDESNQWDKVIQPSSSYLVVGDVGTGKSGLAYWLLERFGRKYSLLPAVVGFPRSKESLLPSYFRILDSPDECTRAQNSIVFIDEADIQLPFSDQKRSKYVLNFLSLPRHRNQIFILAFHFPRLVRGTYLPFFSGFLLKRPPYLLQFAGKDNDKAIQAMMEKAEERFSELSQEGTVLIKGLQSLAVVKNTYVVAPRIRWQGMLENPLCDFWCDDLSKVWAGTEIEERKQRQEKLPVISEGFVVSGAQGWLASDPEQRVVYPVTSQMQRRAKQVDEYLFQGSGYAIMHDELTQIRWVKQVY